MNDADVYFRRSDICPHCRQCYNVRAHITGGNIIAHCIGCLRNVDRNDHSRYLRHFHRLPEAKKRSGRYDKAKLTPKDIQAIFDGGCVHCALERETGLPRRVLIPERWLSSAPVSQLSIFSESSLNELADLPASVVARSREDDHLIPHSIFKRIEAGLNDWQRRAVEKHWKVPSCKAHNMKRREQIEHLDYLVRAFGLYLWRRNLEVTEEVMELNQFVDAVKIAHSHLAYERAFRMREERQVG